MCTHDLLGSRGRGAQIRPAGPVALDRQPQAIEVGARDFLEGALEADPVEDVLAVLGRETVQDALQVDQAPLEGLGAGAVLVYEQFLVGPVPLLDGPGEVVDEAARNELIEVAGGLGHEGAALLVDLAGDAAPVAADVAALAH